MTRGGVIRSQMPTDTVMGKTALVVEGGGMRGVFTAGVLDVFLERRFDPFDLYLGVSSGACNLASHLAGQHRRNVRIYTGIMARPAFLSFCKFASGGNWMDLDYLWRAIDEEDPLDVPAIFRREKRDFLAVGTSAKTGEPLYMRPRIDDCSAVLKASSALPFLYRGSVEIDGERVIDGGIADPLPAAEAYRLGARRIVVVRTRTSSYRKKPGLEHALSAFAVRGLPALSRAVKSQPAAYGRCVDFLESPPDGVEIFQIAPETSLATSRTTQRVETLLADYELGRMHGEAFTTSFNR
jgi:predicted patatin/cPLA2 family phospholipase